MDQTFIGNIGEPVLKFVSSGKAVLGFSLAENHSKKVGDNWEDDGTTWRKVSVWEAKAEALAEVLRKGNQVIVVGSERLREWTGKDGSTGKTLEVKAKVVGVVPRQQSQAAPRGGFSGQAAQEDPWASSQPQASGQPFTNDSEPPF